MLFGSQPTCFNKHSNKIFDWFDFILSLWKKSKTRKLMLWTLQWKKKLKYTINEKKSMLNLSFLILTEQVQCLLELFIL